MRIFILSISVLLFSITAHADWYIINLDTNRATSITKYEPSSEDLLLRNEIAIYSDEVVSLEMAEYRNGDIKVRLKSQEEKNKEKDVKDSKDKKDADFLTAKGKLTSEIWTPLTTDEVESLK